MQDTDVSDIVESPRIPDALPLFLTDDMVLFPAVVAPIVVRDPVQVQVINDVLEEGDRKQVVVALKKPIKGSNERSDDPHKIGCAATILKMLRIPDGSLRLLMQGMARVEIQSFDPPDKKQREAKIKELVSPKTKGLKIDALIRSVREDFSTIVDKAQYLPEEIKVALVNINNPDALADFIASNLDIKADERQEILATLPIDKRLTVISTFIRRELQLLNLGSKIQTEVSGAIEKNQREYFLREQLKAIKKELGEEDDGADIQELQKRLEELA